METQRAHQLLAEERARLELELPELGPHDPEEVPDPFEQSDTGAEVLEDELADAELERVRDELAAIRSPTLASKQSRGPSAPSRSRLASTGRTAARRRLRAQRG
jgi:hypothetical protein